MEGQRHRSPETVDDDNRPVWRMKPRSRSKRQGGSGDRVHETLRGVVVRKQALQTGRNFEG
jgi:hypothetical protein